jgi:hypothetical protein
VTITSKSDLFNRADEAINKTNGNWVGDTDSPLIVSSIATARATDASGMVAWKEGFAGTQSSEITIVSMGSTSAVDDTAVAVWCAGPNTTVQPGSWLNWYGSIGANYRFAARRNGRFVLQKKSTTTSTYSSVGTDYVHAPAVGDKIKITYNPSTGVVTGYVDEGSGYVSRVTYTDPSPIAATQNRIGFSLGEEAQADAWAGSWDDGGSPPATWAFYEYYDSGGGVMAERPLSVTEWDGANNDPITLSLTNEQSDDSSLPLVNAVWADSVADIFGVCVHYTWGTTTYGNTDAVTQLCIDLNVRHVRDRLGASSSEQNSEIPKLYAAGIGFHGTIHTIKEPLPLSNADMDAILDVVDAHPEYFTSLAGLNERYYQCGCLFQLANTSSQSQQTNL